MMTPASWLIISSTLLTGAGYLLWIAGRLPRLRKFLGFFAVVTLVGAIVFHDLEVANVSNNERDTGSPGDASVADAGRAGG